MDTLLAFIIYLLPNGTWMDDHINPYCHGREVCHMLNYCQIPCVNQFAHSLYL